MKKLILNKRTVSNLTDEQMKKVKGATLAHPTCVCDLTESCTFVHICCPPPEENAQKENNIG